MAVGSAGCSGVRVGLPGVRGGKGSNRPPVGLLRPLSIPSRPWSHIAMDFVTGLPPSSGNTVVLTVVDRFSKAVHFIPLPKLPSARETAVIVLDHVFRIHGLPVDVVSDRGPQFSSRFWTEFCRLLGATASLSSVTIRRLTVSPSGPIRTWRESCVAWRQQSLWLGVPN